MSAVANAIDFFMEECMALFDGETRSKSVGSTQSGMKSMLVVCYVVVFLVAIYTHDLAFGNIRWRPYWTGFSFCAFSGSALEFLGLLIMTVKVNGTKSVVGISSKSLMLFATSLSFRVLSTVMYEGYLPSDKSGDGILQLVDACSLAATLNLLYMIHKRYVHTYQDEHDTLGVGLILVACAVSACVIKPDLNHVWAFDTMWTFSVNVEIFQMLPQLFMLSTIGGQVDKMTAHYVANLFASCACRLTFWLWAIPGCKELSAKSFSSMNMGGWFIVVAYCLQAIIYLDFMYYYVKAWFLREKAVTLPSTEEY